MSWKRVGTAVLIVAFALLADRPASAQTPRHPPAPAKRAMSADGYVTARRLGGSTSFYKKTLTTAASVTRMAGERGMEADVR